jgi:GH24 family phage-related lysozyme (muramidase)
MYIQSSSEAVNLIVFSEITSEEIYNRLYLHPIWPGGASGITIGIGYDLSAHSRQEVFADWHSKLDNNSFTQICSVLGLHGHTAQVQLGPHVKSAVIPYAAALDVFQNSTLVKFEQELERQYPTTCNLNPDCFGALVSLFYNRGFDCNPHHTGRVEMGTLAGALNQSNFDKIPGIIRSMKYLWENKPGEEGVVTRREAEAVLFEKGLAEINSTATS